MGTFGERRNASAAAQTLRSLQHFHTNEHAGLRCTAERRRMITERLLQVFPYERMFFTVWRLGCIFADYKHVIGLSAGTFHCFGSSFFF